MKIYINKYKNHWISPYTILDYIFFWTAWSKCSRNKGVIADKDYIEPPKWVDKWVDRLSPISKAIQWFLDKIDRKINYVKIDHWDTWSMDHTLAHIILPMLKQLKETKHGSPFVDDEDVPEYLRSHMAQPGDHEWNEDSLLHMRWEYVLDEMIWAFEQKVVDDDEDKFFDHSESKGMPWDKEYTGPKVDWDGLKAHQARKENGYRLFGKYYQGLWD
mgnify:FL=1